VTVGDYAEQLGGEEQLTTGQRAWLRQLWLITTARDRLANRALRTGDLSALEGTFLSLLAAEARVLNPIYKGELVWNKSEWIKDHETGKRRRHERPEHEWLRRSEPELAIVAPVLWERVQEIIETRAERPFLVRTSDGRRVCGSVASFGGRGEKSLLSGLLVCGICGGGFHVLDRGACGCGRRKDRGPNACSNELRVHRQVLETRIFDAVESQVLVPETLTKIAERAVELVQAESCSDGGAADRAGSKRSPTNSRTCSTWRPRPAPATPSRARW